MGSTRIVVLAVSGGVDSLALAALSKIALPKDVQPIAVVIDHALRPESSRESQETLHLLEDLDIKAEHRTLNWQSVPKNNVQAHARIARYTSLMEVARSYGTPHILTGHHANDLVETFFIRMNRQSSLSGLSSMAPFSLHRHMQVQTPFMFHRPLLAYTKGALESYMRGKGLRWVTDPTNATTKYTRNAVRKGLSLLEQQHDPLLNFNALRSMVCAIQRVEIAHQHQVTRLLDQHAKWDTVTGACSLHSLDTLTEHNQDHLVFSCLARVLQAVSGNITTPLTREIRTVGDYLTQLVQIQSQQQRTSSPLKPITAGGCYLEHVRKHNHQKKVDVLRVSRQPYSRAEIKALTIPIQSLLKKHLINSTYNTAFTPCAQQTRDSFGFWWANRFWMSGAHLDSLDNALTTNDKNAVAELVCGTSSEWRVQPVGKQAAWQLRSLPLLNEVSPAELSTLPCLRSPNVHGMFVPNFVTSQDLKHPLDSRQRPTTPLQPAPHDSAPILETLYTTWEPLVLQRYSNHPTDLHNPLPWNHGCVDEVLSPYLENPIL
eukprot:m.111997 g.111997  ORF g.111997 m.111997 type:complete len:545 (-) comp13468_c0_seq14:1957-3591(-)